MLWSAFLLGLLGSFHCAVMCAPIMMSVKWRGISSLIVLRNKAFYQAGRIAMYIILGIIFYAFGRSFLVADLQKSVSIIIGIVLLAWIAINHLRLGSFNNLLLTLFSNLKKVFEPLVKIKGIVGSFTTGMLNGLLPCGLVYVAAFASVAQSSITNGMQYMGAFGVGTLPLLIITLSGAQLAGNKARLIANRVTPVFITILGIYFILRGLELNIPYLSPTLGGGLNDTTVICEPEIY